MPVTIAKWGNSLAVRIPSTMAAKAQLAVGEPVEVKSEVDLVSIFMMFHLMLPDAFTAHRMG